MTDELKHGLLFAILNVKLAKILAQASTRNIVLPGRLLICLPPMLPHTGDEPAKTSDTHFCVSKALYSGST